MSQPSFQNSLAGTLSVNLDHDSLSERIEKLEKFVQNYMTPGVDYGVIEGTTKKTLFKPGAEKLCDFFGLTKGDPTVEEVRDPSQMPLYLKYKVYLPLLNRSDNSRVSLGFGSCNSHEKKYKWRWVKEVYLPAGIDKSTLKKNQYGQYRIFNDEMDDLDNTILKMAAKRAYIDAVLSGTCSSYLFTQDQEDQATGANRQGTNQQRNRQNRNDNQSNKQDRNSAPIQNDVLSQEQTGIILQMKHHLELDDQPFRVRVAKMFDGKDLPDLTRAEADILIKSLHQDLQNRAVEAKNAIGMSEDNFKKMIADAKNGKTLQQLTPVETVELIKYLKTLAPNEIKDETASPSISSQYAPSEKARWIKGVLNDDVTISQIVGCDAYVFSLKNGPKVALSITHPWANRLDDMIKSGRVAHFWTKTHESGVEVVTGKSGVEVKCTLPDSPAIA